MRIHNNFSLSDIVYYEIGGLAKTVLEIQNKEDLLEAFEYIKNNNSPSVIPIGLGSNLLISDKSFDAVVLWFRRPQIPIIHDLGDGKIQAFASVLLDDIIKYCFEHNLVGFEWAGGLPSSVGGAIRGNAGAFGSETKDTVFEVEVLDYDEKGYTLKTFPNKACDFSYRASIFKQKRNLIIVSGTFQLQKADTAKVEEAKHLYHSRIEHRKQRNPVEYPSCGSVFQNITKREDVEKILSIWPDIKQDVLTKWHGKVAVGYIVKRLGLSGMQVGGAQISEKHSNYIVNMNNATFADVLTLIETIKKKFFETFEFYPTPEVEILS